MPPILLVAFGGALGAALRYGAVGALGRLWPSFESGGIFIVNVIGSGLMGILLGWLQSRTVPNDNVWYLFLGVGVLGGFTTFSAFSNDAAHMLSQGAYLRAGAYIFGSVGMSITAFMLALAMTRRVLA